MLLFSHPVMSYSLQHWGLQHARSPCPSSSPVPKFISMVSVMPSSLLILWCPLLHNREWMYLTQSQKKIGVKCSSCRVRVQNSKFSYRHSELGAIKVNKNKKAKLGIFRPARCSIFFILRKGKEKNSFLFFFFHLLLRQYEQTIWG